MAGGTSKSAERARLDVAAARLGAYYQALLSLGADLDARALPHWAEPPRRRLGDWAVRSVARSALSVSYFPGQSHGYANSPTQVRVKDAAFNADLRILLQVLAPTLRATTKKLLNTQTHELGRLQQRFAQPGADDRLTSSARRILRAARAASAESLPGGTPLPEGTADATESEEAGKDGSAQNGGLLGGLVAGVVGDAFEQLPGGIPLRPEIPEAEPALTFVDRPALLSAIAKERTGLRDGTVDPLDLRDAPTPDSDQPAAGDTPSGQAPAAERTTEHVPEGPGGREVADLLAAIALHPDTLDLLEAYAASPHLGAATMDAEVARARDATRGLRDRLTTGADQDDAWRYSVLVIAALTELGLTAPKGFSEFAVALGEQLGQTKTATLMEAASFLVIGLSIAFTGPIGGVVTGMIDLAFAGGGLALAALAGYERDLASTASNFRPADEKLEVTDDPSTALAVAGAMLSAIGLAGAARPLLKARPRGPRNLPSLQIDDAVTRIPYTREEMESAVAAAGNRPSPRRFGKSEPPPLEVGRLREARTPDAIDAINPRSGLWRSQSAMKEQAAKAAQQPGRRQLATRDRSGNTIEDYQLREHERATADRGTVRDVDLATQPEAEPAMGPERGYGDVDLEMIQRDVDDLPRLEDYPRRTGHEGRVRTREGQEYDAMWERDLHDPEIAAEARRRLATESMDPIAPWVPVTDENYGQMDHIIAVERLRQFHGFARLTAANQRAILTEAENLMAVSRSVNVSRGSQTYTEWSGPAGRPIPVEVREAMIVRERRLQRLLQDMIDRRLAAQDIVRGTLRPEEGVPGLPARLAGGAATGAANTQQSDPPRLTPDPR